MALWPPKKSLGLRTVRSTLGKVHLLERNENEGFTIMEKYRKEGVMCSVGYLSQGFYSCTNSVTKKQVGKERVY